IIIGGGAAGLFCAIEAGKRGKRVVVIERNAEVGRKIIISGGGRCNFTNIHTTSENFVSQNPHFAKSALSRFTPHDFLALIRKHKIAYFEKKLGQLFCRDSSRQIVEMLMAECRAARVRVEANCEINAVSQGGRFTVETSRGNFESRNLVIACGGLSFQKIGATDLGHRIAGQFGLNIVRTRPSLVGLVLEGKSNPRLAGISVDALVTAGKQQFRDNILFTHRGLSGPAILQVSNYWRRGEPVTIDLVPEADLAAIFAGEMAGRRTASSCLAGHVPPRLIRDLGDRHIPDKPVAQLNKHEIEQIRETFHQWKVRFRDTEGYDRAEVTLGGVSTSELSSQTMESKHVPGLFFIGEVVDITGWLGGYNFQWAWASGHAAGSAI
ncbi:MAG TPA: NAD(P)/FAD-dependent oxidoreductase, partial [Pyrinomonadaceae bacterium]|nr:NAD(P)/FAD-dependent oxidoreductase [Pyrinomonadaceae bacterium]